MGKTRGEKIDSDRFDGPCIECGSMWPSTKDYIGYYCPECRTHMQTEVAGL